MTNTLSLMRRVCYPLRIVSVYFKTQKDTLIVILTTLSHRGNYIYDLHYTEMKYLYLHIKLQKNNIVYIDATLLDTHISSSPGNIQ